MENNEYETKEELAKKLLNFAKEYVQESSLISEESNEMLDLAMEYVQESSLIDEEINNQFYGQEISA